MKDKRSNLFSTINGRSRYARFEDNTGNKGSVFGGNSNSLSILEEQNDQYMIDLEAKVNDLKHISTAMRQQVRESNDLLTSLTDEMGSFGILLKGTITKIKSLSGTGNWRHIWAMTIFILLVFFLMYVLFKRN